MNTKEKSKRIGLLILIGALALVLVAACVVLFLLDPSDEDQTELPGLSQEDPQQSLPTDDGEEVPSVPTDASSPSDAADPTDSTQSKPTQPTEPIKGDVEDDVFDDDDDTPETPPEEGNTDSEEPGETPEDNPEGDTPEEKPEDDPENDAPAADPDPEGGLETDNSTDQFQGGVPF